MKGQAIVIKPGETIDQADRFAFEAEVDLKFLQSAVGGPIEAVPHWYKVDLEDGQPMRNCVVFCNEEGKLKGLAINQCATGMWWRDATEPVESDWLAGPIVILVGDAEFLEAL